MFSKVLAVAAVLGSALAQRPSNTSICDYYTTALLKTNNATNQYTLLTLLVNTAVIGNYTQPNHNAVPGILSPNATMNGTKVNLAQYFTGALESTNVNGMPTAVNFLDGGGAAPLMKDMPSNSSSSNQNGLLTHLYSYFGAALNCSQYGQSGFPAYAGAPSQYQVHRYMDLSALEVGYFIQQVGLSAQSFGVASSDVTAVGNLLTTVFDNKCGANTTVIPAQGPQEQSICIGEGCQQAANATCAAYASSGTGTSAPAATSTLTTPLASVLTGASSTGTSPSSSGSGSSSSSSSSSSGAVPLISFSALSGVLGSLLAAVAGGFLVL